MLESHYCCGEKRTGNEQREKSKDESGAGALSLSAKNGKWHFLTLFSWLWLHLMCQTLMGTVWQQSSGVPPTLLLLGRIALAKRDVVAAGERGEHVAICFSSSYTLCFFVPAGTATDITGNGRL